MSRKGYVTSESFCKKPGTNRTMRGTKNVTSTLQCPPYVPLFFLICPPINPYRIYIVSPLSPYIDDSALRVCVRAGMCAHTTPRRMTRGTHG